MDSETEQIFLMNTSPSESSIFARKMAETASRSLVNLEDIYDFSNVCRTCACVTDFVMPIFSGEGLQHNLADKIHKHLPITVSKDDKLPVGMCYQCSHTLLAWHELVKCCEEADTALRTQLQQMQLREQKSSKKKNRSKDHKTKEKNDELEGLAPPPAYRAPLVTCCYCGSQHAEDALNDHLLATHSDLLFHCAECDTYVDKKDFLIHMSVHAIELANGIQPQKPKHNTAKKRKEIDENENSTSRSSEPIIDVAETMLPKDKPEKQLRKPYDEDIEYQSLGNQSNGSKEQQIDIGDISTDKTNENKETTTETVTNNVDITASVIETTTDKITPDRPLNELTFENSVPGGNDENEFSDLSDTENTFKLLPKSVFEAIEDSQDEQTGIQDNNPPLSPKIQENTSEVKRKRRTKNSGTAAGGKNKFKARPCPTCEKVFTVSSSYFYHIKYFHKQERDYECEICEGKFLSKDSLRQHLILHTGVSKFQCSVCGKKFKSNSGLYIHTQVHNGIKTFTCDQCKLSFRWRTHLIRHIKRHAAKKSHVCPKCGRGFSVNYDLLRHIRTHSAGTFKCEKCSSVFTQTRYLKVHMSKKHSK